MKTLFVAIFSLLSFTLALNCLAQPNSWEIILEGYYPHINNDDKGDIYATISSGIIKSTDNGISWDTIFTTNTSGRVLIDTHYTPNNRIIFDSALDYVSTDYGQNWEVMSPPNLWRHRFTSFGDILGYRWGDYNIYRSANNGITWDTSIVLPPPNYNDYLLNDLEVDIFNNIYVTIHYGYNNFPPYGWDEIYKSTNNGNTWILFYESGGGQGEKTIVFTLPFGDLFIKNPNRNYTIHYFLNGAIKTYDFLAISPVQNEYGHIYLLSVHHHPELVLFSPDSGNTWQDITSGLPTGYLQHSNLCNDALGYLYINKDGLYKTTFTTEKIFSESTIYFGALILNDTTHIQVTLQNPFDFNIQIDSIVSYNEQFFISDLQANIIPAGDSITATIAYNPTEIDTSETFIYLYSEFVDARIRVIGIGQNPTSIENEQNIISAFVLSQNYPNPFNPITTIKYQIPVRGFVTLKVYDVLGNEVATLISEEKPAGSYEIEWIASDLPSGIYFYQLRANNFVEIKKMVFIK